MFNFDPNFIDNYNNIIANCQTQILKLIQSTCKSNIDKMKEEINLFKNSIDASINPHDLDAYFKACRSLTEFHNRDKWQAQYERHDRLTCRPFKPFFNPKSSIQNYDNSNFNRSFSSLQTNSSFNSNYSHKSSGRSNHRDNRNDPNRSDYHNNRYQRSNNNQYVDTRQYSIRRSNNMADYPSFQRTPRRHFKFRN